MHCWLFVFTDHPDINYNGGSCVIGSVLGFPSPLRSVCTPQAIETLITFGQVRQWVEELQCKPNTIVSRMVFGTDNSHMCFPHHQLTPHLAAVSVLWSIRAESTVRCSRLGVLPYSMVWADTICCIIRLLPTCARPVRWPATAN